ncbi:Shedu anti-phage system protein SduA domain-containing protein [Kribbella sp. CA-294648]|uniref:Shedu anti-phage system protein SduA domain-containing protein n=1 Tax=Kribbella sp. CA-294648 TaxID=3239948 RepID=UPI003D943B16
MPRQANRLSNAVLAYLQLEQQGRRTPQQYFGFLDQVPEVFGEDLAGSGIPPESILTDHDGRIVGGYTPTRAFSDVVLLNDDGIPFVMIELKFNLRSVRSMARVDDVVAGAANLARAFDGPHRAPYRPCLAVVYMLGTKGEAYSEGDPPGKPVRYIADAFSNMLADGLLDAVCFLAVDTAKNRVYEPVAEQSFEAFMRRIEGFETTRRATSPNQSLTAINLGRAFAHGDVEGVLSGLTSTAQGLSAAEGAVVKERRRIVAELQQLALAPDATETKMHRSIGSRYWLFGGQYVGVAERRTLVPFDQHDIPLLCADGRLEVIELKGPEVDLVTRHRNHFIVTDEIHQAVSQCLNYLRALDELGPAISVQYKSEFGIDFDFRRATGVVVVGHPERESRSGATRQQIDQTIRSYNAHLSRLKVLTYADLLGSAERALRFAAE